MRSRNLSTMVPSGRTRDRTGKRAPDHPTAGPPEGRAPGDARRNPCISDRPTWSRDGAGAERWPPSSAGRDLSREAPRAPSARWRQTHPRAPYGTVPARRHAIPSQPGPLATDPVLDRKEAKRGQDRRGNRQEATIRLATPSVRPAPPGDATRQARAPPTSPRRDDGRSEPTARAPSRNPHRFQRLWRSDDRMLDARCRRGRRPRSRKRHSPEKRNSPSFDLRCDAIKEGEVRLAQHPETIGWR